MPFAHWSTAIALILAPLALAACGGSDADSGADSRADGAASSTEVAAADIDPCEALTPAMIASALAVAETDVTLDQDGMDELIERGYMDAGTWCQYDVAGGTYDGATLTLEGYENTSDAESSFNSSYQTKTEAQLAEIEAAGDRAADEMAADGRGEDLEGIDAGGMLAGIAGKFSFEPIPGLGDQAVVEINAILDPAVVTTAIVRDGGVLYKVGVSPEYAFMNDPANGDAIRDAHVALAREVMAR